MEEKKDYYINKADLDFLYRYLKEDCEVFIEEVRKSSFKPMKKLRLIQALEALDLQIETFDIYNPKPNYTKIRSEAIEISKQLGVLFKQLLPERYKSRERITNRHKEKALKLKDKNPKLYSELDIDFWLATANLTGSLLRLKDKIKSLEK